MKLDLKSHLKSIVWDYHVAPETLIEIFYGRAKTFSLDQDKLRARLLLSTSWYDLLDTLGPEALKEMLSDSAIHTIRDQDSQIKFLSARSILHHAA